MTLPRSAHDGAGRESDMVEPPSLPLGLCLRPERHGEYYISHILRLEQVEKVDVACRRRCCGDAETTQVGACAMFTGTAATLGYDLPVTAAQAHAQTALLVESQSTGQ